MDWLRDIVVTSGLLAISKKLGIPGPSTGGKAWLGETKWHAMHFVIAIFRPARIVRAPARSSCALAELISARRREASISLIIFGVFLAFPSSSSFTKLRIDADQVVEIRILETA